MLIDYGCARKFEKEDGTHCPDMDEMEYGNAHFASLNAFKDQTLSRRDDLIQVLYNLMVLQNNFGPLRAQLGQDDIHHSGFIAFKRDATAEDFCRANNSGFLIKTLEMCYELRYEQEPDYGKIKFTL